MFSSSTPKPGKKLIIKLHESSSEHDSTLDCTFTGAEGTVIFKSLSDSQIKYTMDRQSNGEDDKLNIAAGGENDPAKTPLPPSPLEEKSQAQLVQAFEDLMDEFNQTKSHLQHQIKLIDDKSQRKIAKLKAENDRLKSQLASSGSESDVQRHGAKQRVKYVYVTEPQHTAPSAELINLQQTVKSLQQDLSNMSSVLQQPKEDNMSVLAASIKELASQVHQTPRTPVNRGPNITLPEFTGAQNSSFERWARDLEVSFNHLGWGEADPQRRTILPTLLKKYARAEYDRIQDVQYMNFKEVMQALNKLFAHSEKPIHARYQHTARQQRENETVRNYSADILQRMEDCQMHSEESRVITYINGLLPHIRIKLACMEYNSLTQAISCAEKAENAIALKKQLQQGVSAMSFRPSRKDMKKKSDKKPRDNRSRSKSRQSRSKSRATSREGSQSRSKSSDQRSSSKHHDHKKKSKKNKQSVEEISESDQDLN
jgi:hypothetical protein